MFNELNHFGGDFDKIVKKYSIERKAARERVNAAAEKYERAAKSQDMHRTLAAQATLESERAALHDVENGGAEEALREVAKLRGELEAAAGEAMAAKPEDVDRATMLLLEHSNILSVSELTRLYNNAESVTMKRLIADAARAKADSLKGVDGKDRERQELRFIAEDAKRFNADLYLHKYDELTDAFKRGLRPSSGILERWDELAGEFIANF